MIVCYPNTMKTFFAHILQALKAGKHGALATIVQRKGSVPRKEGAHLFLTASGALYGTIGGGGLEAEVIRIARGLIRSGTAHMQAFTLVEGDDPSDMVCGGNVTVLIEPISPETAEVCDSMVEALGSHVSCCFVRLFRRVDPDGSTIEVGPRGVIKTHGDSLSSEPIDEALEKQLSAWAQAVLKEEARMVRILEPDVLAFPPLIPWDLAIFEALHVFPRLVIFGGGHLSKALCAMASLCRFQVEVIDDREEFANKARFPEATRAFHLPDYQRISDLVTLDSHTFVVIATRGHRFDEIVLEQIATRDLPYIGMVGSRQKNIIVFQRLREKGIPQALIEKVHAPIGLPIHSETPEEIAVSILAEIIQSRSEKRK